MVIGFIGAGNMAAAMARGWSRSGSGPSKMIFTDNGSGNAGTLATAVGGEPVATNEELVEQSDAVVLAMKPGSLAEVAASIPAPGIVLSLLAATPLESVAGHFPESSVVRLMPNLAVEVNRGVICVTGTSDAAGGGEDSGHVEDAVALLDALGEVIQLNDNQMNAATAVMGCSPAYFAQVADALVHEGIEEGLDPAESLAMVTETLAGSAELLRHRTPFEIQVAVASPGGSTEAGLEALAAAGGPEAFRQAVEASLKRMRGS